MKDIQIFGKNAAGTYTVFRTDSSGNLGNAGTARTSNPTAATSGDPVAAFYDDLGRQITRPYQARDLIYSATATLTTGTAATLFTGVSTFFADLKQLTCANNSTASATITISDESTVVRTIQVPASSTLHLNFDPPLPQSATGTNWSADMEDITGTTVTVYAEFLREV